MNIRDPNLPVNLTSFRALQNEVARLDEEAAPYRLWRDNAEKLCPVLQYESPGWIDAHLREELESP